MFFVAFNKRQKRIVEVLEEVEARQYNNQVLVVDGNTETDLNIMNVVQLEEEIDLD